MLQSLGQLIFYTLPVVNYILVLLYGYNIPGIYLEL